MDAPIKKLMIVGGGTSGWMAATYLDNLLNSAGASAVEIILVESPDVGIIGVGESTFDTIRSYCATVGLDEAAMLKDSDAVLKHGTYFVNWYDEKDPADKYYHPFEIPEMNDGINIMNHWVNLNHRGLNKEPFDFSVCLQAKMAYARKSPRSIHIAEDYQGALPYSYNFDAILFGRHLKKVSKNRGVKHIEDHVTKVVLGDQGEIKGVETKKNGFLEADFFIDCTGWAAVLSNAVGNTEFLDYTSELLCDRALAMQVPFSEGDENIANPRPYTTATAQTGGWIWEIDLHRRRGTGYVYSSQFTSDDEAEKVFREFLGPGQKNLDVRKLKMRIGRRKKFWHKNCLCVGLSGGFVEPLEATGIMFIDMGLRFFGEHFPSLPISEKLEKRYNKLFCELFDETSNFIILHYILTKRQDSDFWKAYANDVKIPDSLAEKLDLWKHKVPSNTDFNDKVSTFIQSSYSYILYGMRWKHEHLPGSIANLDPSRSQKMLDQMVKQQQLALQQAPSHIENLEAILGKNKP